MNIDIGIIILLLSAVNVNLPVIVHNHLDSISSASVGQFHVAQNTIATWTPDKYKTYVV
jgi:hypothetical protein